MDKIDDDKVQSGGSSAVVAGFPIFGSTSTDSTELRDRVAYALNHRRLNARQVQLTSMAGAIGALLFVGIGSGVRSGPLALLIGKSWPSHERGHSWHTEFAQDSCSGHQ